MNLNSHYLLFANFRVDFFKKDYYPFGMVMPERSFSYETYGFGFNGMLKDDEIKGSGNSLDFGNRVYDPRIAKWMSRDKILKSGLSSYMFGHDNPINIIDPDGKDDIHFYYYTTINKTTGLATTNAQLVIEKTIQADRFYNHVEINRINLDAKGDDQFTTFTNTTQFYPFIQGANSGLGSERIPFASFSINMNDRAYLIEKAREFPQLSDYISSRYQYSGFNDKLGWEELYQDLTISNYLHGAHAILEATAGILMLAEGGTQILSPKSIFIDSKIAKQMGKRGWTNEGIADAVNKPYTTRQSTNLANGNPATAFFNKNGTYVVKDNLTDEVIQISNQLDPTWIPDKNIKNPYIPEN